MTEPTPPEPLASGRDESTPFWALSRVALVCFVVFAIVCGIALGLYFAFR